MSVVGWIVFGAFAALFLAAVRGLFYFWRGESAVWDHQPAWWPWGELAYRAWVRVMPIGVATLGLLDAIHLAGGLGAYDQDGVGYWLAALLLLSLLGLFFVATTVAFYNRPKWIVPPHLRREPGIVEAYEKKRRSW